MRRIRPERGVTLIELVLSMVVLGIIAAVAVYFVNPLLQSGDTALRAELSDIADNALQRIGRDVRLALPNSVRVTPAAGAPPYFVEFLAVREAGRYRGDSGSVAGGTACDDTALTAPENDQLSFDLSPGDTCFKTIGKLANPASVVTTDFLVLNNYGTGFSGQNAYEAGAANRTPIDAAITTTETNRDRVHFTSKLFSRALHDSPGKRFFVISGPVSYVCDTVSGTITRYWNYGTGTGGTTPLVAQPTTFGSGSSALIAENVSGCSFSYATVGPQLGLLTLRITLRKALSGGAVETVSLYQAIHVNNAP